MTATKSYAAQSATSLLAPFSYNTREVGPNDVLIDIMYSVWSLPLRYTPGSQ